MEYLRLLKEMTKLVIILGLTLLCTSISLEHPKKKAKQDLVVVEGDIMMTERDYNYYKSLESGSSLEENDWIDLEDHTFLPVFSKYHRHRRRPKRAVSALPDRLWPNKTIPFIIGPNITDIIKWNIFQAMGHWEKLTCLMFVNRTTEKDYIKFDPGPCGCCSFVGRKGDGEQTVTLSPHCAAFGVVVHELGHVIGFWHEHSRPDRDKYIKILKENVVPEKTENFDKKLIFEIDSLGQPYDYNSIMHYRKKTFSRNGKNTLEPRQRGTRIGQRDGLSPGDVVQARLLYDCPKPNCYEEFTENEANFSTPNYPIRYFKEHECIWIIHNLPGERIFLEFQDFAIERSENCSFDFVEIRQGIDETGKLIGRFCGEGKPGIIESTGSLWIHFKSDNSLAMRGFLASYWKYVEDESYSGSGSGLLDDMLGKKWMPYFSYAGNCNGLFTQKRGMIQSPLMPVGYTGKSIECSWTIDGGSNATRIQLALDVQVVSMSSIAEDSCLGDIYQQVGTTMRHVKHKKQEKEMEQKHQEVSYDVERYARARYSCKSTKKILLNTQVVMIQWSSDVNKEFKLSYIIDHDECDLNRAKCQHFCKNTLDSFKCYCKSGYWLHANGWQCLPKLIQFSDRCGGNFTSERGKLRSSTEPLIDCFWYINLPVDYRITFTFTKFNVPSNITNRTCEDNYVEFLTGKNFKVSKTRYCGVEIPPVFTTPKESIAVKLHTETDTALSIPYFSAKYIAYQESGGKRERCYKRVKLSENITSPGYPDNYPSHSMCIWRVSARKGHRIVMTFQVLDIERTKLCHFDFVEVHDGRSRLSPFISRYCGKTTPKKLVSKSRHLWIMFLSDRDGSGRGFLASFDSEPMPNTNKTKASKGSNHHESVLHNSTAPVKQNKRNSARLQESKKAREKPID